MNQFDDILGTSTSNTNEDKVIKSKYIEVPIKRFKSQLCRTLEIIDEAEVENAFILGGAVRYACSPRKIPSVAGDIDIYCENEDAFNKLKNHCDNKHLKRFSNEISSSFRTRGISHDIQIIKPVREGAIVSEGSMEEILNNFDFTVIRTGINKELFNKNVALVDEDFPKHEKYKRLVLKNIHCPISSLHRCMKYHRKGYKLASKEALKLFLDWEQRTHDYRQEITSFMNKKLDPVNNPADQAEINRMYMKLRVD